MLKKALQGAISASMLLNGMIVYTPIVLNAQENKAKSTQTQNVLSLESRIPKVVIENNGGNNFLRLATVQGQTNFTFSADVTFTNPNEQQSAALVFGIRSGNTDDSLKANVHGKIDWNVPARVWGYGLNSDLGCPGENGSANTFFKDNSIDLTSTFNMKVVVQNKHLQYFINDKFVCEGDLNDDYNGGDFGFMTYSSKAEFSNILIQGDSIKQGYANVEGTTIYGVQGDAHALLSGVESVKAFTYEADVNLINGGCAALTFGIQDFNNPGASWLGANFNFNDLNGAGRIRVFSVNGAGIGENNSYTPIIDIDKTQPIHMKLDVTKEGIVTFSVGNNDANTHTVSTTLTNYTGGY